MKNTTRFFGLFATLLALAAPVMAAQIGDDSLTIGKKGSSANKTVKMGAGRVVWNQSSSKLTFSNDGGSSFKNLGSGGGGGGGINLLQDVNFDFEGGTAGWSVSAGSLTAASSGSNLIFDVQSGVFNASATGQILSSSLVAIPEGFKSGNGAAGCFFKTTASDYKLQVFDGTNVIAERVIPAITGAAQKIATTFIFPSSGSIRLRVASQSDAADLAIDNCFLGENALVQVSQSHYYGGIKISDGGSCSFWNATSSTFADFSAATGTCTYVAKGGATAPATQLPAIKFASMAPGEYVFMLKGGMQCTKASGDAATCYARFYDGTTELDSPQVFGVAGLGLTSAHGKAGNIIGHLSLANAASNKTISVQMTANTAGTTAYLDPDGVPFSIDVYYYPTQIQSAFTPDTTALSWSGLVDGGSWATSSGSMVDGTLTGTLAIIEKQNRNFGTVSTNGNTAGISFSPPRTGTYKVCVNTEMAIDTAGQAWTVKLTDSTGTADYGRANGYYPGAVNPTPVYFCGHVPITSLGTKVLKLQFLASGGSAILAGGAQILQFDILAIDQPLPAPVIVGGVVTQSQGVKNIVAVDVCGDTACTAACTSDPCSIGSNGGEGVTSITRSAAGHYLINFAASTFSSRPVCTSSNYNATNISGFNTLVTTSQVSVIAFNPSTTVLGDDRVGVVCIGNK